MPARALVRVIILCCPMTASASAIGASAEPPQCPSGTTVYVLNLGTLEPAPSAELDYRAAFCGGAPRSIRGEGRLFVAAELTPTSPDSRGHR